MESSLRVSLVDICATLLYSATNCVKLKALPWCIHCAGKMFNRALTRLTSKAPLGATRRLAAKSESEVKHDDRPEFPGSRSQFTTELKFVDPTSYDTIPIFRILDQSGKFISKHYSGQLDLNLAKRFYKGLHF